MLRNPANQSSKYLSLDQAAMDDRWRKDFEAMVDDPDLNAFMDSGPSYILYGDAVRRNAEIALVCLKRAAYSVYRTTPMEILRRMEGKETLNHTIASSDWEDATCYFIFDFLIEDELRIMDDREWGIVLWFITEAVRTGNPIVIVMEDAKAELAMYGDNFADFLEHNFERIRIDGTATKNKRKK